jgi:hypothetical protein
VTRGIVGGRERVAPGRRVSPRRTGLAAIVALALVGLCAATGTAAADPARTAYVARGLAAVRRLGPTKLDVLAHDMYAAARTQCRSDAGAPAIACLLDLANRTCNGAGRSDADAPTCEAATDVIATNLRAANDWVDEATRARLVREATDYRTALAAKLHDRYAALASELVLADGEAAALAAGAAGAPGPASAPAGGDAIAAAIDRLCAERDRVLHACRPGDATCVPSVPWSRCVAALVWFVGGAR